MSNTGVAANGESLEECTTNVFALADARGLRWKKFGAAYHCPTSRISDDPVLSAYAQILSQDVLCVWQRCTQSNIISEDPSAKLLDWGKELVIFWYGEEPILAGVVNISLKEIDSGCFDYGLPAEYQNLFFKALHNLLERYLLGNGFICTGRWFAKPLSDKDERGEYLAFSFNFFIYGESLVATVVDVQKKPSLRKLMKNDLATAHQNDMQEVVLSPYGLKASITGESLSVNDIKASKLLDEWSKFYPAVVNDESSASGLPPVVEVIQGETRMLYPSNLILVPVKKTEFESAACSSYQSQVRCTRKPSKSTSQVEAGNDEKENTTSKENSCLRNENSCVDMIWDRMEGKKEKSKSTRTNVPKTEGVPNSAGNSKALWDFKDSMRHIGCGCTSSTNVSRSKPLGRFGTNWSQPRSNPSTAVPSPSSSSQSTPTPTTGQRSKRDKKKIVLPFHQRRSVTNERSSTPPVPITRKMGNKTHSKSNSLLSKGRTILDEDQSQFVKTEDDSEFQPPKTTLTVKSPLEFSKCTGSPQIRSPNSTVKTDFTLAVKKYHDRHKYKKEQAKYALPGVRTPQKPVLIKDHLEPRTELTDPSFSIFLSLKTEEESMEINKCQIVSPPSLTAPMSIKANSHSDIKDEKLQGIKRITESNASPMEVLPKKIKLEPLSPIQSPHSASTTPATTPNPVLPPTPSPSEASVEQQPLPQQQQPTKRGPGRPRGSRKGSTLVSMLSPETFMPVFEEEVLSPPGSRKGRRSSSARAKEESAPTNSAPSVRGGRGRPRKGQGGGRQSKKDQPKTDTMPENSKNASLDSPSLESKMPSLPSPPMSYFSPPTPRLAGMSFTHDRDLMACPTDLDHLFESDEEGEDGSQIKLINGGLCRADATGIHRYSSNDDVTKIMHPQSVTSGLPHDLAKMFPTPPSQEPPTHATSPAMPIQGEYLNPACLTALANVLSPPEKQPILMQERQRQEIKKEVQENEDLTSPFQIPEYQELPVVDSYTPLLHLPSKRYAPINLPDMNYKPSWETGTKSSSTSFASSFSFKLEPPTLQRLSSQSSLPADLFDPTLSSPLLAGGPPVFGPVDSQVLGPMAPPSEPTPGTPACPLESGSLEIALTLAVFKFDETGSDIFFNVKSEYRTVGIKSPIKSLLSDENDTGIFVDDASLPKPGKIVSLSMGMKPRNGNFRPVRPKTLALPHMKSESEESQQQPVVISDAVLEIFKDQWSSPFSACHLTSILKHFYLKQSSVSSTLPPNTSKTIEYLRDLSPAVQEALQKSLQRSAWDVPKVEGPVNFRSLQKLAGKTAQISGVPVHPLLVGSDGDWASVSPVSLKHWQKLMFEPFGGSRDVAYVVVSPESDFVLENTKQFFKELGHFYESMNLGRHCPITTVLRDGIMRIGQKSQRERLSEETVDEWFSQDDSSETTRLKFIAQVCKGHLGPHLASVKLSSSLFDKEDKNVFSPTDANKNKGPASPGNGLLGTSSMGLTATSSDDDDGHPPAVVVYMIDPFQVTGKSSTKPHLWSFVGLMRAFAEMLPSFSNNLRNNVILQIIPLECILQFKANSKYHFGAGLNSIDTRQLALSVYSRCRLAHGFVNSAKAITSFSIATTREKLFKKKQEDNQLPSGIYTPPCILAPMVDLMREDLHSPADLERIMAVDECDILFCAYCLSNDRKWILVTCTDKSGTLSETCLIKVNYTIKPRRRTSCPRILALRRLWNFILSTISFSLSPWRIVLSRLGKPGRGELKDLNELMQKEIVNQSVRRRPGSPQPCHACSVDTGKRESPSIQSISFVTTELENSLKLLPVGGLGKLRVASSRIFVVPAANQSVAKPRERPSESNSVSLAMSMPMAMSIPHHSDLAMSIPHHSDLGMSMSHHSDLVMSMSHHSDLVSDSAFMLPSVDDDDTDHDPLRQFLPLLHSPSDAVHPGMLPSPNSEMNRPVFSPGGVTGMTGTSPFQPIMHRTSAFKVISPISSHHPVSSGKNRMTETDFEKLCRQPLAVGYHISGKSIKFIPNSFACGDEERPSIVKTELRLHVSNNDPEQSAHPLDTKNHLHMLRFILEQLDSLSWLTVDPSTGERQSPLASHICLLCNFHETFNYLLT